MGLNDIGIKVIHGNNGKGNAQAVLNQLVELLAQLVATGEGGSVDLAGMPLSEEDYDLLEEVLGEGEVSAEVNSVGPTRVFETGISGVWWVTHYNDDDDLLGEFLEVAYCPEILLSPTEDVQEGLEALRARLIEEHINRRGEEHER